MLPNNEPHGTEPGGIPQGLNDLHNASEVEDTLFEDILDVEGSLRQTPAPAINEVALGIEGFAGRIPQGVMAQLRCELQDLRSVADSPDPDRAGHARAAIVETLVALRGTLG